jgi:hypothetical protein
VWKIGFSGFELKRKKPCARIGAARGVNGKGQKFLSDALNRHEIESSKIAR